MQMTNHQELLFFKNSKIIEVIMLLKKKSDFPDYT